MTPRFLGSVLSFVVPTYFCLLVVLWYFVWFQLLMTLISTSLVIKLVNYKGDHWFVVGYRSRLTYPPTFVGIWPRGWTPT